MRPWHRFRLSGQTGQLAVFYRTDTGETVRWDTIGPMRPAVLVKSSGWMPAWSVGNIPVGFVTPPSSSRAYLRRQSAGVAFASAAAGSGWDCASHAVTTCGSRRTSAPSAVQPARLRIQPVRVRPREINDLPA